MNKEEMVKRKCKTKGNEKKEGKKQINERCASWIACHMLSPSVPGTRCHSRILYRLWLTESLQLLMGKRRWRRARRNDGNNNGEIIPEKKEM